MLVGCCLVFGQPQQEIDKGIKLLKSTLDLDPCYQFQVYPVDNFGVGTAYTFTANQPVTDRDFICATFSCLKLPVQPVGSDAWLNVDDAAAVGSGGQVVIHGDSKSTYGTGVVLPGILKMIKADFSANFTNNTTVDITIPKLSKRLLDKQKFATQMDSLPVDDPLKKAFRAGNLDYVVGDVVAASMTVVVTVNPTKNISADATLTAAKGVLDSGASANFKMTSEGNGKYTLTVSTPVILAYCHRQQPQAGSYGVAHDWSNWTPVNSPIQK
jgi:hypothetical protein